jgi:hypothetical protein
MERALDDAYLVSQAQRGFLDAFEHNPARSRPGAGRSPMNPNADRAHPRAATLLVLLLLVGAGFGLALRFGVFGTARANQPLLLPVGTDRVRELDLEPNTGAGATTVSTSAVTDAVTTEIAGYRGVERTSGRLIRDQDSLDLVLTVTINNRADLDAV